METRDDFINKMLDGYNRFHFDESGNPLFCPKCSSDLVHDTNNVFNRCLNCGWYGKRINGKEETKTN